MVCAMASNPVVASATVREVAAECRAAYSHTSYACPGAFVSAHLSWCTCLGAPVLVHLSCGDPALHTVQCRVSPSPPAIRGMKRPRQRRVRRGFRLCAADFLCATDFGAPFLIACVIRR